MIAHVDEIVRKAEQLLIEVTSVNLYSCCVNQHGGFSEISEWIFLKIQQST